MRISEVVLLSLVFLAISVPLSPSADAAAKRAAAKAQNAAFNQANSLAGHSQYKQAIEKYKQALAQEPNNAAIHHMYGRTMALMGLLPSAVDEYRIALKLQKAPNSELENDIGVALAANDEPAEAAIHLKKAVTMNPKFIAAFNNLGVALARVGDYRAARDAFQASLKMQPTNKYISQKLNDVTAKLGMSKHFDFTMPKPDAPAATTTAVTPPAEQTPDGTESGAMANPVKVETPTKPAEQPVATVAPKKPEKPVEQPVATVAPKKPEKPVEHVTAVTPKKPVATPVVKAPVATPAIEAPPAPIATGSGGSAAPVAGVTTSIKTIQNETVTTSGINSSASTSTTIETTNTTTAPVTTTSTAPATTTSTAPTTTTSTTPTTTTSTTTTIATPTTTETPATTGASPVGTTSGADQRMTPEATPAEAPKVEAPKAETESTTTTTTETKPTESAD